ncbi:DNA-binding MarR family transcriptional regulator [Marinomonas foliarum]|uniref:DNA-binding MarR family transcriptional regulator n=1 Tax=Marinomonas foliarum TaxID=491950 RepID=A0A369ACH4_9GAMM|nr:DNA-binding MarR family transcriptional regulator [Marinomonas foliarum]
MCAKTFDKSNLKRFCESIKVIRVMYPEMTLNALHAFLISALEEGVTMADMAHRANFSQSSSSRNTALLSAHHRYGRAGLDLIRATEDPRERRRKLVHLTAKGRRLVSLLADINKPDV